MAKEPKRITVPAGSAIAVALSAAARDEQPVEFDDGAQTLRFVPETRRDRLFSVLDRIRAKNVGADPDEVLADVTAVVEEVRRENYERRRVTPGGD